MKVYIKASVPINKLKEQFGKDMEDELFDTLISLDPTTDVERNKGGKYCPWIFRQYKKGNIQEKDFDNVTDALIMFAEKYKKFEHPDIGQYKTFDELLEDSHRVGNLKKTAKEEKKELKRKAHQADSNDKKFLVEDGDWEVWQPLTYEGSISLARTGGVKAKWCTAYEGNDTYWRSYTSKSPLFIFINTKHPDKKYQLQFPNSWYDINDDSKGMNAFYQFCTEHPIIGEYFEIKTKNGVQYRANTVIGFDENAEKIVIEDGVTAISHTLPRGLKQLVLPDSITSLKSSAFSGLSLLKDIRLPKTITEIPERAFKGCTSLVSLVIPDSVTSYGNYAFEGCTNLKTIKNSANLKSLGNNCFDSCSSLEYDIPNTVERIGKSAFPGCTDMTDLRMPDAMSKIDIGTFENSSGLVRFDLNRVTEVSSSAFRRSSVSSINIENLKVIGSNAFRGCDNLEAIEFNPEGVNVGPYAFADSKARGVVVIYETTKLNLSVFDNCPNIAIDWEKSDEPYEFDNIYVLRCSERQCPKLIEANKGYIKIETTEGKVYEVQ